MGQVPRHLWRGTQERNRLPLRGSCQNYEEFQSCIPGDGLLCLQCADESASRGKVSPEELAKSLHFP